MTTFLQKNGLDLAVVAVVAPLTSYGLHRMFPAPDAAFLVVATTVSIFVGIAIRQGGSQLAQTLSEQSGYVNSKGKTTYNIFYQLNPLFTITSNVLIPIFARSLGQRMGFQVPGYLQTVAYFSLTGSAIWSSKTILEILREAYNRKPERPYP